ncbi:hypothetical protein IFM89_039959 [Coptis chinensis]|uniref:Uncharacterized protein n=1 Tax=Coptis chinensis TaxID=261450 RepID=A0A835GU79_9MAGN|nr:hypothetical protein IFM89_039959 [Coptis chinensis]
MPESTPLQPIQVEKERGSTEKVKKKPFRTLFQREGNGSENNVPGPEERGAKSAKKQWGFDGLKKWKKNDSEDEAAPLPLGERSDDQVSATTCHLVSSPMAKAPTLN